MDIAQRTLLELIATLGITPVELSVTNSGEQHTLQLTIENGGLLIGVDGERMKALDMLVRMIAEKKGCTEKFHIDVNGYHKEQVVKIEQTAKMLADRARSLKYDVEMSPMKPYERMLVHAALTNEPGIKTESIGLGKERRVVIKYIPEV